jgi:S-adenosylmethionine-diacylglycerol 3-amino-3-carboxypropyl transferase
MCYSLGIPPAQFSLLLDDAAGDLAGLYRARVRRLACEFPLADNYFAWQAFGRSYDVEHREAIPEYLREENYERLRERAHRVETRLAPMTEFLGGEPVRSVDRYVLLDAQDWMSDAQLQGLWSQIDRTARPGARVIFRTAAEETKLEDVLPARLRARWTCEKALGRALLSRDRSAIYGGFHVFSATH